jgi:hypothetical protein
MSEQEYIEALNNTQGIVVKRIAELEEELVVLRHDVAQLNGYDDWEEMQRVNTGDN